MLAGGLANLRPGHVLKHAVQPGNKVIVLGGPAMLIGLGGGAASSVAGGASSAELDFASVQRDNAEMERRCQEVIDACWARGEHNPIVSVHDVGAGGLSNAIPELLNDAGVGGVIDLSKIPCDDPSLSPMQMWSNESQERYVLAIGPEDLAEFEAMCAARALPVRGGRRRHGRAPAGADRPAPRADRDRPADGCAVRQAAADASRRHAAEGRASTWCRTSPASAWTRRCCACCACPAWAARVS